MRIHGYCTGCRRIKRVRVRNWMGQGVALGICDDCDAKSQGRKQ